MQVFDFVKKMYLLPWEIRGNTGNTSISTHPEFSVSRKHTFCSKTGPGMRAQLDKSSGLEAEFMHFRRVLRAYWRPRLMEWAKKSGRSEEPIWPPGYLPSATLLDKSEQDARPDQAGPGGGKKDKET